MVPLFGLLAAGVLQNPSFEEGKLDKFGSPPGWTFFVIAEPIEVSLSEDAHSGKRSYMMKASEKGEGFLHSSVFDVEPGAKYRLSVWVKGKGSARVEALWWKEYNEVAVPSDHHRDASNEVKCTDEWQRVVIEVSAPKDAKRAYLRLAGKGGEVLFDDASVERVEGGG